MNINICHDNITGKNSYNRNYDNNKALVYHSLKRSVTKQIKCDQYIPKDLKAINASYDQTENVLCEGNLILS